MPVPLITAWRTATSGGERWRSEGIPKSEPDPDETLPPHTPHPENCKASCRSARHLRRRRGRRGLLRHGEAGFQRPAGAAFQAADAAGHVHLLIHVYPHRTAAAAEIALDALAGLEAKVEQAEPVEQGQQPAQGTEDAAPRTVDEERRGKEGHEDQRLEPTHRPTMARHETLSRSGQASLQCARGTEPADGDRSEEHTSELQS